MKLLKKKLLFCLSFKPEEYSRYRWLYFCLSEYRRSSVRDATAGLCQAGFLDKIIRNNQALFRLTALGKERFYVPASRWDKFWRLAIIHHCRGNSRSLERDLEKLGYRRFSRSVYLSPFPLTAAAREKFLATNRQSSLIFLETKELEWADNLKVAAGLWNLDELNRGYTELTQFCRRQLRSGQGTSGFKRALNLCFRLKLIDPGLPRELLGPLWPAKEAAALFNQLALLNQNDYEQ